MNGVWIGQQGASFWRQFAGLLAAAVFCLANTGLVAQTNDRPTSLDIVPQSAAFYLASMNHAAQYEAFVESNAFKQLMDCEVSQRMRKAYRSGRRNGFGQFGRDNPFGQYLEAYAESVGSVPGKMVINYLSEIFGNEVFVYGDQDWIELSRAMAAFYQEAGVVMQDIDLENMDPDTINRMLDLGAEHLGEVNTPHLVLGTVLDSPGGTKSLLQIAEAGIDEIVTQIPAEMEYVLDGYKVVEEDDLYLLSFQLDADSMPWETVEEDPEIGPYLDKIKAIIGNKSINISLGVKGRFFIFAIGPDPNHVRNLGSGDLLIDHEKMQPLKAVVDREAITSVRYTSEEMAAWNMESIPGVIDSLVSVAKVAMQSADPEIQEQLTGLTEDLEADADELKSDLQAALPEPGAYLGFSYLTGNGFEGYVYNWAENRFLDSSQPLTLMQHVGASPTMFVISRDAGSRSQFGMVRKWLGRIFDRVIEYVPRTAPSEQDAEMFVDIAASVRQIMSRLADTTENDLLAATENCQSAFVLDFSTAKKSWHPMMPPSDRDLPIPSMAALIEHQDKEKILATGANYMQAAVDVLDMIRDIPDSGVPEEYSIPRPEMKSAWGGDLYYYPLPQEAGLDESLSPHALVQDDLLILGYSLDQTERLLSGNSPQLEGILGDSPDKLMAISYYNNREMIDALYTWCQYGLDVAREEGAELDMDQAVENDTLAFREAELMDALDHVVNLVKCLESCSSMSYMEDGVQVTHYQMLFKDVADE